MIQKPQKLFFLSESDFWKLDFLPSFEPAVLRYYLQHIPDHFDVNLASKGWKVKIFNSKNIKLYRGLFCLWLKISMK